MGNHCCLWEMLPQEAGWLNLWVVVAGSSCEDGTELFGAASCSLESLLKLPTLQYPCKVEPGNPTPVLSAEAQVLLALGQRLLTANPWPAHAVPWPKSNNAELSPCQWAHVRCNEQGFIRELDLSGILRSPVTVLPSDALDLISSLRHLNRLLFVVRIQQASQEHSSSML